jgi:hypothetical protein
MSNKASKTELPEAASALERLMAVPVTMTWAENRKIQRDCLKATEEARKKRCASTTLSVRVR